MVSKLTATIAAMAMCAGPALAQTEPIGSEASQSYNETATTAHVPAAEIVDQNEIAIDATDAQLDSAKGGWWYVAVIGGAIVVRYCSLNKLKCARAAHEVYGVFRTAKEAYDAAKGLACRKGWIRKGC